MNKSPRTANQSHEVFHGFQPPTNPDRPDSGRPLPVQSNLSVQNTGQSAASVQSSKASRAGRFAKTAENRQLHSLLHIKVLWLATCIKQA